MLDPYPCFWLLYILPNTKSLFGWKMPCTALVSSPVCMFSHVADGMFLYANHDCWVYIYIHTYIYIDTRRVWLYCQILPFWKLGTDLFSRFCFKTGNQKTEPEFSYFYKSLLQINGRFSDETEALSCWEKVITNRIYCEIASKNIFFGIKTERLTEMEGSNDVHPGRIFSHGLWRVLVLTFAFWV